MTNNVNCLKQQKLTNKEIKQLEKDIKDKNAKNVFNLIYKKYEVVFEKLKNA